jgi:hypothetical protein
MKTWPEIWSVRDEEHGPALNRVEPHAFSHNGWRFWQCHWCFLARRYHPTFAWRSARPLS